MRSSPSSKGKRAMASPPRREPSAARGSAMSSRAVRRPRRRSVWHVDASSGSPSSGSAAKASRSQPCGTTRESGAQASCTPFASTCGRRGPRVTTDATARARAIFGPPASARRHACPMERTMASRRATSRDSPFAFLSRSSTAPSSQWDAHCTESTKRWAHPVTSTHTVSSPAVPRVKATVAPNASAASAMRSSARRSASSVTRCTDSEAVRARAAAMV